METKKNYEEAVAFLCRVDVSEITKRSQRDVVDDLILPKAVMPTGQCTRGWRISPYFMAFMAEWGDECFRRDQFSGAILLEIAMQRLSCGAVLHRHHPTNVLEALPQEYRKYSAAEDQPGLMGNECYSFLLNQMEFCLKQPSTAYHAKAILLGLVENLTEDGDEVGTYCFNHSPFFKASISKTYAWAYDVLVRNLPFEELFGEFLVDGNWRKHKAYLHDHYAEINWKDFFERIHLTGLNNYFQRRAVKQEIHDYEDVYIIDEHN